MKMLFFNVIALGAAAGVVYFIWLLILKAKEKMFPKDKL